MRDANTFPKAYKDFFITHNIRYIDSEKDLYKLTDALFVTSCSKTKSVGKNKAVPKEFYISKRNLQFYKLCEINKINYAIQSDKYELHFPDEELEFYDVHPSKLTKKEKQLLGKLIFNKCTTRHIDKIVFCNSSPCMSKPYLEMLYYSKMDFYYLSDLTLLCKCKQKKLF